MYRYLTCATAFVVMTHTAHSQCSESDENRVLLVGDSWAFFMGADQTINTILERWGRITMPTMPTISMWMSAGSIPAASFWPLA